MSIKTSPPPNLWRAWSDSANALIYLLATYDRDAGEYIRPSGERGDFAALSAKYGRIGERGYSDMRIAARAVFSEAVLDDAILTKAERAAGYSQTIRGIKIERTNEHA